MTYSKVLQLEYDTDLPEVLDYYLFNKPQDTFLKYNRKPLQLDDDFKKHTGITRTAYGEKHFPKLQKKFTATVKSYRYSDEELKDLFERLGKKTRQRIRIGKDNTYHITCLNCKTTTTKNLTAIMRIKGCENCKVKYGLDNPGVKTYEEFLQELSSAQLEMLTKWKFKYNGAYVETDFECLNCGFVKKQGPGRFVRAFSGYCPRCSKLGMSNGEYYIKQTLEAHNIEYIKEYQVKVGKQNRYFDFYIPSHNVLFEYDGIQHSTGTIYSEDRLEEILASDTDKTNYAEENNLTLIRINNENSMRTTEIVCETLGLVNDKIINYLEVTTEAEIVEYYRTHTRMETVNKYNFSDQYLRKRYKEQYGETKAETLNNFRINYQGYSEDFHYDIYKTYGEIAGRVAASRFKNKNRKLSKQDRKFIYEHHEMPFSAIMKLYFDTFDKPFINKSQLTLCRKKIKTVSKTKFINA